MERNVGGGASYPETVQHLISGACRFLYGYSSSAPSQRSGTSISSAIRHAHFLREWHSRIFGACRSMSSSARPLPKERKKRLTRSLRILTVTTSDGQEFSLDASREDEESILKAFVDLVVRIDPDIIEGHELFTRQLPFLVRRAEESDIELTLGRNGSLLRSVNFRALSFL